MLVLRMIILRMGGFPMRRIAVTFRVPLFVMLPVLQMERFGLLKGMLLATRQGL